MSNATIATNATLVEVCDALEDHGFVYNGSNSNDYESEWVKDYRSGNSTVIEVVLGRTSVEIYRGEFNKDDVQLGAKASAVMVSGITNEARNIIARKAA